MVLKRERGGPEMAWKGASAGLKGALLEATQPLRLRTNPLTGAEQLVPGIVVVVVVVGVVVVVVGATVVVVVGATVVVVVVGCEFRNALARLKSTVAS